MVRRFAGATLCLFAAGLCVGSSAAEFSLSGTVVNAAGTPLEDVAVWLVTTDSIRPTETDADGFFRFVDQSSGPGSVVAYREGLALGGANVLVLDDTSVEIALAPAIDTPLRTVDPRMRPIAGARLARMRVNDSFDVPAARLSEAGLPAVRSDREGRFVIPYLAAGDFARIEIDHRSFAKEVLPALPAGTAIDAVLPFGEAVRGRVLTPAGEPAEGAEVSVFRSGERGPVGVGDAVTGPDGFYTAVVPPGSYHVTARHTTYGLPRPVPVEVTYEEEVVAADLTLQPTTVVSGATLDENGAPVMGVHVRYVQQQLVLATAVSDSTGRYALRANLGEGVLRFSPPKRRAILGEQEIRISVEGQRPVALPPIRVAELPAIEGTVSADVERLDEMLVSTLNLQTNVFVRPDADGRFTIALEEFPVDGVLKVRAEHAYRFARGEASFHVFDDPAPQIALEPFQPDLSPARENYPNNLEARVGSPAPELACEAWVNSEAPVQLADLRGKVVVLTLWASFDRSARAVARMHELQQWHEIYSDGSVAFVAVHEGTTPPDAIQAAVQEWGISFPVGQDTETFQTFDRYSTNFVPQTVLIDKTGIVRYYDVDGRIGELIKDLRRR